jgi:hypothetical protein
VTFALVFVLTAWHPVPAGLVGRPLHIFRTNTECTASLRRIRPKAGERLTCQPMHLPHRSRGTVA